MDYAVWNTLHDGSIEAIGGAISGDIEVRVEIAYLCAELPTAASHVVVHLRGCRRFEYRPFDGEATTDLPSIASAGVEVLSAQEREGRVVVTCVSGLLALEYERVDTSLAAGQAISQAELEAAAHRYWTKWAENARRARG